MKSIRIKNIRSISDSGEILIKPLTFFLGRNSSGKSTVLRALPLLTQSVKTRSNAPILWYGDLVDFGSASEVVSTFARNETIEISVTLDRTASKLNKPSERYLRYLGLDEITFSISLAEVDGRTKVKGFEVYLGDDKVSFEIERTKISILEVNGIDLSGLMDADAYTVFTSEIVPQLFIRKYGTATRRALFYPTRRQQIASTNDAITRYFKSKMSRRIKDTTIAMIVRKISYHSGGGFVASLERVLNDYVSGRNLFKFLTSADGKEDYERLKAYYLLANLPSLLTDIDHHVSASMGNTSYVGPSRATGERYYRMQELAIDKIDPQGQNLAMFLNSLHIFQQNEFSEWLEEAMGYALKIERSVGHIQIKLREVSSNVFYNLADMGYGFSQILPIMAQVWSRKSKQKRDQNLSIVAMEQPELHLHPALQAELADVFVRSVNQSKGEQNDPHVADIKFVIETHSEALINRVGELIHENAISHEDVAIYIFDKPEGTDKSDVRSVTFNKDGILENWPVGFFSPLR